MTSPSPETRAIADVLIAQRDQVRQAFRIISEVVDLLAEPTPRPSPTDVVAWAMDAFWGDSELSHKASEYDACLHATQALEAAGYAWSDAAVRRAADVGYVLGQLGLDQRVDRTYHAVIAATILETEDVL